MTRMDDLVRETVGELADEAQTARELAGAAMIRGRRMRRRRHLLTVAGAVVAVAAIAVPFALAPRSGGGVTPAATATAPTRRSSAVTLAGGWVVTGAGSMVLNRSAGSYATVMPNMAGFVQPAPVGNLVAFVDGATLALLTSDGRPVRALDQPKNSPLEWSAQGDRLVASRVDPDKETGAIRVGFTIIDGYTGERHDHWLDPHRYDCSMCHFVFTRDGKEVALAISDREGGEGAETVAKVQLFDAATGEATRTLEIPAMPSSAFSWSPDGRYLIAAPDLLRPDEVKLFDLTTGTAVPLPHDAVWADAKTLLVVDDRRAVVMALNPQGQVIGETGIHEALGDATPISIGPAD
jgi:hypothetical protein